MELEDERQMLCERCRKFVPVAQIKFISKGNESKMALCLTCLKNFNIPGSKSGSGTMQHDVPGLENFFCERCNYKFKFNTSKNAMLRCPYCGKSDKVIAEKTRSADTLLKGSADF